MSSNFERLLAITTSFFDTKNDPDQLQVDEQVITRLLELHPATVTELVEGDGPVLWILLIPTSLATMHAFLNGAITEAQLFEQTSIGSQFEAVYLCSASILPEYRNKGFIYKLTCEALVRIQEQHAIKALYFWPFSVAGKSLAHKIAQHLSLPLYEKAASND